jgi:hypothetical protein
MEVQVEPLSERFDRLDDRWLDHVALFVADLRREVGNVERRSKAVPGMKGLDLGSIAVSLSSAGAFAALASVIKAFIERDNGRSVRATLRKDGKLEQLEISGSNVQDVERLIASLASSQDESHG